MNYMMNKINLLKLIVFIFIYLFCAAGAVAGKMDGSVIGPGDTLKIYVYGHSDLTTETKVNEIGNITFPLLGEILVEGLTASAAERKIAELLENKDLLRNPQINIFTAPLQSQMVSVLGHVRNQGRYPIEGKRNLTEVIAMAGGIIPDGGDIVTVISSGGETFLKEEIDMLEMIRSSDLARNVVIRSDDLVFVERAPRFYIYGEVQRPGTYRLERNMTVMQALSVGGGLTLRGTERGLRIQRREKDGLLQTISVKKTDLIQADDVIYVKESLF